MARNEDELHKNMSDKEITAWFEELREPTPEEEARIGKLIDEVLTEELGRPPRISSERARLINAQKGRDATYAREDVQTVGNALVQEIDERTLSVSALTAWRRHLIDNHYEVPPTNPILEGLPPITTNSAALGKTHIDIHQNLGPNVDSVLFTGNHFHTIALSGMRLPTTEATHNAVDVSLAELQRVVSEIQGKVGFGYRVNRQPKP